MYVRVFVCVCIYGVLMYVVCVCVYRYVHMSRQPLKLEALDPTEMELQAVVSRLTWVL